MVAGDLVIAGSCSGILFAFDRASGTPRWSYHTELDGYRGNFHGTPLLDDGTLIIGTDSTDTGYLYAFDVVTGEVRWKREFPEGVAADLLRLGDTVYAVTLKDRMLALDLDGGTTLWSRGPAGEADAATERSRWTAGPATDGRRIFRAGLDGHLEALDPKTGKLIWTTEIGSPVSAFPIHDRGAVIVGSEDGKLHRLAARTGKLEATFDLPAPPRFQITPVPGGYLVLVEPAHTFLAVDRRLRRILWQADAPEEWTSFHPALWSDAILVGDSLGELVALDPATGAVRWQATLGGHLRGLGGDAKTIFAGTLEGRLFAVRPPPVVGPLPPGNFPARPPSGV